MGSAAERGIMSRSRRGGLTLTELLVAMSILLIGIYAVARGFPALFGTLEAEEIRTTMARAVEARMDRLKSSPQQIPAAIYGYDPADGALISPDAYPDADMEPIPGNPRDDLTRVVGERFRVPGLQGGATVAVYPLNIGPAYVPDPADVGATFQVYRLERLERVPMSQQDWITQGRPLDDDEFFLDSDGYLYAPPQYQHARVSYSWADTAGVPHGVGDEIVTNVNYDATAAPVRAASVTAPVVFANVLPESAEVEALVPYTTMLGGPGDAAPGVAVLEANYGATVFFHAQDAGAAMRVNYQLRSEPDLYSYNRRVPFMIEEFTAPIEPPYQMTLAFRGIDDATALFTNNLAGAALAEPVHVLILDLLTGDTWTSNDDFIDVDFVESVVTIDWAGAPFDAATARGHNMRVYYRTINGHTMTVQKAPEYYIEAAVAAAYPTQDAVAYRQYTLSDDPDAPAHLQLLFPASAAGQAIVVDYIVGDISSAGRFNVIERVNGEMHVINGETLSATLNVPRPDVDGAIGVMSVRGVSLTVRGWWHDSAGRVQMMGIDTFLTPEPLL